MNVRRPRSGARRRSRGLARALVPVLIVLVALAAALPGWTRTSVSFSDTTDSGIQLSMLSIPAVIADASWWLNATADDLYSDASCTTPATTSGAAVECWGDHQVAGRAITSTTGPAAIAASPINGRRAVRFTSSLSQLVGPDVLGGSVTDLTVFAVVRENVRSNNWLFNLNGSSTTGRLSGHIPWGTGATYFDAGGCCTTNRSISSAPAVGTPMLFTGWKDSVAGHSGHQINNGTIALSPGNTAASTVGGLKIGHLVENHDIGEFLVFPRRLTPAEEAAVETYLMTKWRLP